MGKFLVAGVAAGAILVQGCSSKPREFTPVLAAAPADQTIFDSAYAECRTLLAEGKLDSNGRLASGAAGAAAGAATLAAGSAAASGAGLYGGMAVAGATLVALPVVAIAGAWGLAKAKRNKKEKRVQAAMSGCLKERGHEIVSWGRVGKAVPSGGPSATE